LGPVEMHARAGRRAPRRSIAHAPMHPSPDCTIYKRWRSFSMPLISQPTQSTVDPSTNFITILRHYATPPQTDNYTYTLHHCMPVARTRARPPTTALHRIAFLR
jgi:hypothetical protein